LKTSRRCYPGTSISRGCKKADSLALTIDPRKIGNRIGETPVVGPEWLEVNGRPFVLVYVANHGAREEIMEVLEEMGYRPGKDCLAVG